jgi:TetR/AcrR family transcriptional regulator, tetracycline repressor protein
MTRERVLDVAFDILRRDGLDGLTMRALAAKLGVAVTAIYWHVGDKQALLDELVDRIIAEVGEVRVTGGSPSDRLLSIGRSLRQNLLDQPHLVALVHRQGRTPVLFLPAQRIVVEELTKAEVRGADAALAVHAFLRLVIGSVILERTEERSPEQRETVEELWAREPSGLDRDLAARLARPVDRDEVFEFSLAALVRAVVTPPAPLWPAPSAQS